MRPKPSCIHIKPTLHRTRAGSLIRSAREKHSAKGSGRGVLAGREQAKAEEDLGGCNEDGDNDEDDDDPGLI
jgi:hypothetical protein